MTARAIAVLGLSAVCGSARASAPARPASRTLLLLSSPSSDLDADELGDAVRVQVLDLGVRVQIVPETDPGAPLPTRLHQAVAQMQEHDAAMAVFYDRGTGDPETVIYVARSEDDEALLAVIRLPEAPGPTLHRSFAIRMRDLVQDLLRIEAPPPPPPPPPRFAGRVRYAVIYSPALGALQHGPEIGLLYSFGGFEASFDLGAELPYSRTLPTGTADLWALRPTLGLAAPVLRRGRTTLAIGAIGGIAVYVAEGRDDAGRSGEVTRAVPFVGAAFSGRFRLTSTLALDAAAITQLMTIRQRFTLDGPEAFDLGRVLFGLRVGLAMPLQPD